MHYYFGYLDITVYQVILLTYFATMTAGYSILGSSVEVITYSFDVCKSFKEIYMTVKEFSPKILQLYII